MSRRIRLLILIGLSAVLVASGAWQVWRARSGPSWPSGQLTADPATFPSATYRVGDFLIRWDAGARQFTVESPSRPGFILWQTLPGRSFVQAAWGTETVREARGMFRIRDTLTDTCGEQQIRSIALSGDSLEVNGRLRCRSGEGRGKSGGLGAAASPPPPNPLLLPLLPRFGGEGRQGG